MPGRDKPATKDTRNVGGNLLGGLFKPSPSKLFDDAKEEDGQDGRDAVVNGEASVTTTSPQTQARRRKGSLRQAAMAKMREHSSSLLKERVLFGSPTSVSPTETAAARPKSPMDAVQRQIYQSEPVSSSQHALEKPERVVPQLLASPLLSSPEDAYASTTEEDERPPVYQASASSSISSFGLPVKSDISSLRRRSHQSERRPSADAQAFAEAEPEDDWDYSETEWWGWIILIVTWVTFVVVMGSCFGVWSWAWDVGETPYAPPELEDDDTLPITGYYPALIVCTAVMSWVWVVIAWVGMKYFRHAKMV